MDAVKLTEERGKVYGHPLDDFGRAAKLKAVVAVINDPELRHAAEMVCVKLARLCNSPDHLDTWDDIAGYGRTGRMVIEERKRRREGALGTMSFKEAAEVMAVMAESWAGPVDRVPFQSDGVSFEKTAKAGSAMNSPAPIDRVLP